jgi:hypothetical protein
VIVGDNELQAQRATVRVLPNSLQSEVAFADLISYLQQSLQSRGS